MIDNIDVHMDQGAVPNFSKQIILNTYKKYRMAIARNRHKSYTFNFF